MQMLGKSDAVLIGFDAPDAEDPADLARHAMDFWLTTEDLPLPGNRVLLGRDGRIQLRYTQTNAEAHRRLIAKFKGLLGPSSAARTSCPATPTSAAAWGLTPWRTRTGPCGSAPTRRPRRST